MFSFEGVPAIYFNSLFGKSNDEAKFVITGNNRDVNRYRWNENNITNKLQDKRTKEYVIFNYIKNLLIIRNRQKAFHPNASREAVDFGKKFFSFKRISLDKRQTVLCVSNLTSKMQYLKMPKKYKKWQNLMRYKIKFDKSNFISLNPFETIWLANI